MTEAGNEHTPVKRAEVHFVLAHSYTVYFFGFIFAVLFDTIFPMDILSLPFFAYLGLTLILLAPALILWAQGSSKKLRQKRDFVESDFRRGPYAFSRNPTHLGLALMLAGFGLLMNSFFVVVISLAAFAATKIFFLKKEEKLLAERYGEPYLAYKSRVKF